MNPTTQEPTSYDLASALIDFEQGELDATDTVRLFQHLVDTGMAWTLQGFYGRTAARMIEAGLIHRPESNN